MTSIVIDVKDVFYKVSKSFIDKEGLVALSNSAVQGNGIKDFLIRHGCIVEDFKPDCIFNQ